MNGGTETLWSPGHEALVAHCQAAIGAGALAEALWDTEHADADTRAACARRLQLWADAVARTAGADPLERLRRILAQRAGLRGDPETDYTLEACGLGATVRRRRGMPILLSAIWMLVAEGAGLAVRGIALPGHFIVRVGDALVDPFHGGRQLSVADCRAMVERVGAGRLAWDDRFLDPASTAQVVHRVIRNRIRCAQRARRSDAMYRAARLGACLQPREADAWLAYARAAEVVGAHRQAIELYRRLARNFTGTPHARVAEVRARALATTPPTVH